MQTVFSVQLRKQVISKCKQKCATVWCMLETLFYKV